MDSLTEGYQVLDRVTVRGDREATYSSVGSGSGARTGLACQEADGLRLAVYAHTDLPSLQRLAEAVEPCTSAC